MKQELAERSVTGQKRRIKAAKFPSLKTLDEFDMTRLENVSESTIRQLASCDFIKQRQNIVMIGNPGSGKTHLSIALGMNACEAGYNKKSSPPSELLSTPITSYKKSHENHTVGAESP